MTLHHYEDVVDRAWRDRYHSTADLEVVVIDEPGDERRIENAELLCLIHMSLTRCDDL